MFIFTKRLFFVYIVAPLGPCYISFVILLYCIQLLEGTTNEIRHFLIPRVSFSANPVIVDPLAFIVGFIFYIFCLLQ